MKFTFNYTGVRVRDLDAAVRFYTEGLGMTLRERSDIVETGGTIVELVAEEGGHMLELNWYPPGSRFHTPYAAGEALDHLAFGMPPGVKLEQAIQHLERAGGKLRIAPFQEGQGRIAYVDSPDEHTIELYERAG